MRLWLDDIRPMPSGFDKHVTCAADAIIELVSGRVTLISFDHDLGMTPDGTKVAHDGNDVARAIEDWAHDGVIPRLEWRIHSANPTGRQNIEATMLSAERWWEKNEEWDRQFARHKKWSNNHESSN